MVERTPRYDVTTALVVVDVQNDFADPDGSLTVPGADVVIEAVNNEVEAAAEDGAAIIYTMDWHPARTPHFVTDGGPWPVHCVRDTWGAELHPDLIVKGGNVLKGIGGEDGYSGFTMRAADGTESSTGLHELLRDNAIERVIVVGLALDYCVKATALDALARDYDTTVVRAATAPVEVHDGDGRAAEAELAAAGVSLVG